MNMTHKRTNAYTMRNSYSSRLMDLQDSRDFPVGQDRTYIADHYDEGYFEDMNGNLYVTDKTAAMIPMRHRIRFYGGSTVNVAVLDDRTETMPFGLYGEMTVICDEPDMRGNYRRVVHFGIYNAIALEVRDRDFS